MDKTLEKVGVVPVVVIDDAKDAVPMARALVESGLPIIEVTLRTAAAPDAIKAIANEVPEAIIGAGTVLSTEHVQMVHDLGASFVVSPGFYRPVVEACQQKNLPIYPGIASASELQAAWNMGLRVMKFFPAEQAGGVAMLKALSSVFRDTRFMPTGGVNKNNIGDYLGLPAVIACGGSWLTPANLIAEKNWAAISELAREATDVIRSVRA